MVKQLTLILFSIFLCVAFARGQIVEWSNQQKVKSRTSNTKIIGENTTGLYLLRAKSNDMERDITIEKYRTNLALEKSEELKQPIDSKIIKVLLQNDGLLVLASKRNDSLPYEDFFYWKLNSQLQQVGSHKLITQIERSLFDKGSAVFFQGSANAGHYSLLLLIDGLEKNTSTINLWGFNETMNEVYQKRFSMPNATDDIVISGFECDNDGNSFALIDFPKPNEKKQKTTLRSYFLYGYYPTLDKILEYNIERDSTVINDIGLVINNYKKVINVAGFYSTKDDNKVVGSFVYAVDLTSTLMQYNEYEPLSKTFTAKVIGLMRNEADGTLSDLYIRKLIPRSDAGVTIVAEKFYETRQTYTYYANGFPQTASRITYNYDEIIVLSKKGDGKTQYNELIKKNQTSMNDGGYYSSFILLNAQDKLSFIYNENTSEESDVLISSLNPLGQLDTKILIKALSYYVTLMPLESKQITATSVLICTLKDRRFTLMKLTY